MLRLPFAGLLFSSVLIAAPANAQNIGNDFSVNLGATALVTYDVLSLPPLIADAVYIGKGVRPPLVWPILGMVFGAGGVVLGLSFALPNASSSGSSVLVAFGAGSAALGAINVGLAIWSLFLPRPQSIANWTITPMVLRRPSGPPAYGASLSLLHF